MNVFAQTSRVSRGFVLGLLSGRITTEGRLVRTTYGPDSAAKGRTRAMRIYSRVLLGSLALVAFAVALEVRSDPLIVEAKADQSPRSTVPAAGNASNVARANDWNIGIAGGLFEGPFIRLAVELAKVLDDDNNLRVLPVITYGAAENVSDLLYTRGIDLAITYSDGLNQYKKSGAVKNIDQRINYISKLYEERLLIYARPEVKSLSDLQGKKIGF